MTIAPRLDLSLLHVVNSLLIYGEDFDVDFEDVFKSDLSKLIRFAVPYYGMKAIENFATPGKLATPSQKRVAEIVLYFFPELDSRER